MRAGLALLGLLSACPLAAQETEIVYLSGRGAGTEVPWEFRLAAGRGATAGFTTIKVPGHWEQQGFGAYNYGHDKKKTPDVGFYRHRFAAPEAWRGKRVELVFEGVMTDTLVQLNGQPAGARHQGGFTRFGYDVSALLRYGGDNVLEVEVHEVSADDSIEDAERQADYWVFGGIYRPVYLAVSPPEALGLWPLDARADGTLQVPVGVRGLAAPAELELRVTTPAGEPVGSPLRGIVAEGGAPVELRGAFAGIATWNAEEPRLYRATLELRRDGAVLHRASKNFGFRTVELRNQGGPGDGLYVNGRRILLKGVNRHVFFPDTGRTSSPERDRADAEIAKALHLNAIRTSHYPPDVAFLDACDELGLYVIDELPGWHHAYATAPGRKILQEMVERDADHPAILLWANGNEGGHNFELDADFARHDPQGRLVIHPQKVFSGFDTFHYPTWSELVERLDPRSWRSRWRDLYGAPPLFLPTEFQHALYDGGGGASLEDFWTAIRASPLGVGGFLWAFTDEAIARSDRHGKLDTDGNHAPDGILGPWRESSGSSLAVAQVFAPIVFLDPLPEGAAFADWDGKLAVENRHDFLDLARFRLDWRALSWTGAGGGAMRVLAAGSLPLPKAEPGGGAELDLAAVPWRGADGLELRAVDAAGRVAGERTFALRGQREEAWSQLAESGATPRLERQGERVFLREGGLAVELDAATGALLAFHRGGRRLPLAAPLPTARVLEGDGPATPRSVRFFDHLEIGGKERPAAGVDLRYDDPEATFTWLLDGKGRIRFSYLVRAEGQPLPGVFFPLPAERLTAFSWLGIGPTRVWGNRREGRLGFYSKKKIDEAAPALGQEPVFAGNYGPLRRAELDLREGKLGLLFEEPSFLGVLVPSFPEDADDARAEVLPREGFSLLLEVPAIGNKFDPAVDLGPQGAALSLSGLFAGVVWFSFE